MSVLVTAAELRERVVAFRRYHASGGPLHIVVDDGNIEDHWIQACLDGAELWYRDWYDPQHEELTAPTEQLLAMTRSLGEALLAASKTQRRKACR